MRYTEFILNGAVCDVQDIKDDSCIEVFGRKWLIVKNYGCIIFYYLSENDLLYFENYGILPDLKKGENTVMVNFFFNYFKDEKDYYVDEYYQYEDDDADFNGYKKFDSVDDAMKWCLEHTYEEIHLILSEEK